MLTRIQKGNNFYVIYPLANMHDAQIDTVSMMMINNNQKDAIGLASISLDEMNGQYSQMLFDVTGKVALREYLARNISQKDFRRMLLNLIATFERFDEYMIDVRQVLLDLDSVYINSMDFSISFLCIAIKGFEQQGNLHEFFRVLIQNSRVNATEHETSYFNRVWNVIFSENGFSLGNIRLAMECSDVNETSVNTEKPRQSEDVFTEPPKLERVNEPAEVVVPKKETVEPPPAYVPPIESDGGGKKGGIIGSIIGTIGKITPSDAEHSIVGILGDFMDCEIPLDSEEEVKIGSDAAQCNVPLSNPSILPVHCSVSYDKARKRFRVTSFSDNGVVLNNGKVLTNGKPQTLSAGTTLSLGDGSNKFRLT